MVFGDDETLLLLLLLVLRVVLFLVMWFFPGSFSLDRLAQLFLLQSRRSPGKKWP